MGRRRLTRPAVLAAAAVVAVAGCSSSGSPGGGGSTGGATGAASGTGSAGAASGSTYTIGTIASITGPYAASIGGLPNVVTAWTKWTNAHGGVNGHPVKVIVMDDASVPGKGIAAAQALIGTDHIAAIVGAASNTEVSWYKIAEDAKVPVIGGQSNGGALYQSVPMLFPTGTTSAVPVLNMAKTGGATKLANLYCSEVPACASYTATLKQTVAKDASLFPGTKIVYSAAVSGSAPNYTAQCLAARQAGANALVIAEGAAVSLRVVNDCASQGYKPVILGSGAQADNTWLKDPAFEGTYVYQADFPWVASSTPAQQDFQNALKQYAPGELTSVTFNPNDSQVWAALEVFKAAIERAKPTSFTASTVLSSIYALPASFSIPGITPPLTYAKNAPNPNIDCYFLVQIKSGKWMVPGSGNPICPGSS